MKKIISVILLLGFVGFALSQTDLRGRRVGEPTGADAVKAEASETRENFAQSQTDLLGRLVGEQTGADAAIAQAYKSRRSNVQVQGTGKVIRILADDLDGSRHQRFILRLSSGQMLLVAHNIDLAWRVADLANGDQVEFYGEYEWNDQGGVIHWTHHDPQGRHEGGWLKHRGRQYQ